MKLVSYLKDQYEQIAILVDGMLYDTGVLNHALPDSMNTFLVRWDSIISFAQSRAAEIETKDKFKTNGVPIESVQLLAPVPYPPTCRDGYAFRQHVAAARRNRGLAMIAEFDEYPVFYFTNHHSIQGPGDIQCMPDHFDKLDFELECAIVICKEGRNIEAEQADEYIGGLMIMNDMSARTLQMEEMLLNLGPAKGKDFSTVIGPWLVTLDELKDDEIPCKEGHSGKSWNLNMTATVNGIKVSEGNLADMDWTFAELIERASYGATLYPGDVIGSGTVGTGCFLELNGTAKINNPDYEEQWLQQGDLVELEIEKLGKLSNIIVKESSDFSIRGKKKQYAY